MKIEIVSKLKIGDSIRVDSEEGIRNLCLISGRENVCKFLRHLKCIHISDGPKCETGRVNWICETGILICENGYHYNVEYFLNKE